MLIARDQARIAFPRRMWISLVLIGITVGGPIGGSYVLAWVFD